MARSLAAPERSHYLPSSALKRWALPGIFLLSLGYSTVGMNLGLDHYDEGLVYVAAVRILGGEIPYRDFWACYTPGQYYLMAGLFGLFGPGMLVARISVVLVRAGLMTVLYLLSRRLTSARWAWLAWVLALSFSPWMRWGVAIGTALFLALSSLLCFLLYLERGGRWLLPAGVLVGFAMLFRQDLGLYAALAEGVVLLLYLRRRRLSLLPVWQLVLPAVAVVAPVAVYLLSAVPLATLIADFYTYPLKIWPPIARIPYPTFASAPWPLTAWSDLADPSYALPKLSYLAAFWFPPLVLVGASVWLLLTARRYPQTTATSCYWAVALFTLLGIFSLNYVRVRSNYSHLFPLALPAALLLGGGLGRLAHSEGSRPGWRGLALGLGWVLALVVAWPGLEQWGDQLATTLRAGPGDYWQVPRARGMVLLPAERANQAAVQWVQAHVPPGESIYVGHYRHDYLRATDVVFYFLAERPVPTHYHDMIPGIVTTPGVQRQIIAELEAHHTRYAILDCQEPPPGEEIGVPGSRLLDDWLRARFRPVARIPATSPGQSGPLFLILRR